MKPRVALLMLAGVVAGCGQPPPPMIADALRCARRVGEQPPDDGTGVKFYCSTPIFSVTDLQQSLRQYERELGFDVAWTWGEPATFAAVRRGHSELFFCERCQGQAGTWVTMYVDDVDALHREYLERGATVVKAPVDESWGLREMTVQDRDGHVLRLAHALDR